MDSSSSGYVNMVNIGITITMQIVRKATRVDKPFVSWLEMTFAILTFLLSCDSLFIRKGRKRKIFKTLLILPARAPSLAARVARTTMTFCCEEPPLSLFTITGSCTSKPAKKEMSKTIETVPKRSIQKKNPNKYDVSVSAKPKNSKAKMANTIVKTMSKAVFVDTCATAKISPMNRATKSDTMVNAAKTLPRRNRRMRSAKLDSYQPSRWKRSRTRCRVA
mmetsp:Transcript_146968/g.366574  ORF Transcript_146968/g.366574 Transcript_146968/m.366574 type:complete len:220 (-) Transcript_146968:366-1025(-)